MIPDINKLGRHIIVGDLLSLESILPPDGDVHHYIVHGCNNQGVMGSGIANMIKRKYLAAYETYMLDFRGGSSNVQLGHISCAEVAPKLNIVNAITQQHYGRDSSIRYVSYKAVQTAFSVLAMELSHAHPDKKVMIHYPLIGAGLGGGNWSIIGDIINKELEDFCHCLWIEE